MIIRESCFCLRQISYSGCEVQVGCRCSTLARRRGRGASWWPLADGCWASPPLGPPLHRPRPQPTRCPAPAVAGVAAVPLEPSPPSTPHSVPALDTPPRPTPALATPPHPIHPNSCQTIRFYTNQNRSATLGLVVILRACVWLEGWI